MRDLWRAMADAAVDDSLHVGPYRPHITLGVWDDLMLQMASSRIAVVVSDVPAFEVRFRAIGIFPPHRTHGDIRRDAAVWLCPTVTPQLRRIHEQVHAAIRPEGRPVHRYVPGRWNPHCTLAWRLTPQRALTAVNIVMRAAALPLSATITRIGLIDTPAEIELKSFSLAA